MRSSNLRRIIAVVVALVAMTLPQFSIYAQEAPFQGLELSLEKDQPVKITSGRLEFSPQSQVLTFSGGVVVSQPGLYLTADRLVLGTDGNGRILKLEANGKVSLTRQSWKARTGKLIYDRASKTLTLEEYPAIEYQGNTITGSRITLLLDEGRLIVDQANTTVNLP
jgi:lipopolysaccharide transport protein LptA